MKKNRKKLLLAIILIIVLWLASRSFWLPFSMWDALWAMMIFYIVEFFTSFKLKKTALVSLTICFAVEFSQLLDFAFLNEIRNNFIWKLILGQGFLVSDLIAYSVWILICVIFRKLKVF